MRCLLLLLIYLFQVASVCATSCSTDKLDVLEVCAAVIDECGEPVAKACVSTVFFTAPEQATTYEGETNLDGLFAAKSKCNGEMRIWVRKDGYYESCIKPDVVAQARDKDARLLVKVLLKKIHKPTNLVHQQKQYWLPPKTNEFIGIDIEIGDWCSPYGLGKHEDFRIKYESWNDPLRRLTWGCYILVNMPNAADGFYISKADCESAFHYEYNANTNRVYEKQFDFTFDRTQRRIVRYDKFNENEYLVFRTRSVTNELGEVVKANYGRIDIGFSYLMGISFDSWFNPIANDLNLENKQDE